MYGLLNRRIRVRVSREDVNTFNELLAKTRSIGMSLEESLVETLASPADVSEKDRQKLSRIKCAYCRITGHHINECRKKRKLEKPKSLSSDTSSLENTRPVITCYGCGTPGVIRSNCPTFGGSKPATSFQASTVGFFETTVKQNHQLRPLLPITIHGVDGVGFADSGAQANIAGTRIT